MKGRCICFVLCVACSGHLSEPFLSAPLPAPREYDLVSDLFVLTFL